jgi:hypothetical protein
VLAGALPDDELEPELQAPSTTTTAPVSTVPASGLTCLFMGLLHRRHWRQGMSIMTRDRIVIRTPLSRLRAQAEAAHCGRT